MVDYTIEPRLKADDAWVLCDEQHAERFYVMKNGNHIEGWFDSRVLAETALELLIRRHRFIWGKDDVEHHE